MVPPSNYSPPSYPSAPQTAPSNDEKLLAALAHGSILIHQFGLIAPLIIWLVHRDGRAPYVAYQAKQAFVFHLAITVATWLGIALGFVLAIFTFGLSLLATIPFVMIVPLASMIYGVIGAIHAFEGRDFRYWIVGDWVRPD